MTLLDFSNYATEFKSLRNSPIQKSDIDLLKEFQKRKIDAKIAQIRNKANDINENENEDENENEKDSSSKIQEQEGNKLNTQIEMDGMRKGIHIGDDFVCSQGNIKI